jgi:hypothetical protein
MACPQFEQNFLSVGSLQFLQSVILRGLIFVVVLKVIKIGKIRDLLNQSVSSREEKSNAVAPFQQIGLTKLRFVPYDDKKSKIFVFTVRQRGF